MPMIQTLRHFLLPHHTNNFKARLLHLDFIAVYMVGLLLFSFIVKAGHKIEPSILGFATNIHVQKLVELTNQKRTESGAGTLTLDSQLSQAAAEKAAHMFQQGYWAHNGPDGRTPWDFINRSGYVYTVAGENLAKNFSDSEGVVEAWLNSPSHRENLLKKEYNDIGFAVVNGTLAGEETTLVVQMFGTRLSQAPPSVAESEPVFTPPVAAVIADEPQTMQTTPADFDIIPSPIALKQNTALPPTDEVDVRLSAQSVVSKPLFDISTLSRKILMGLSSLLILVLVADGLYIWRHRVVRLSGRTAAHLLFLLAITGVVWMVSFGAIV